MFRLLNDWPFWRSNFDVLRISRQYDWLGHVYTFKLLGVGVEYTYNFPKPPTLHDHVKQWEEDNGIIHS